MTALGSPYPQATEWQRIGDQIGAASDPCGAGLRKRVEPSSFGGEIIAP